MTHIKCWVCNNWTPDDLIEKFNFDGAEAPVCFECAIILEQRAAKLRQMRRVRNVTPSSGSTLADQLTAGRSAQGADGGDTQGAGAVAEPVGEGPDVPDGAVARTTQCTTEGCTRIATYTQLAKHFDGRSTLKRRCSEHKSKYDDLEPGWVIEGIMSLG